MQPRTNLGQRGRGTGGRQDQISHKLLEPGPGVFGHACGEVVRRSAQLFKRFGDMKPLQRAVQAVCKHVGGVGRVPYDATATGQHMTLTLNHQVVVYGHQMRRRDAGVLQTACKDDQ